GMSMAEASVTIANVQRFSTEDGPGIRTTVFFKGCPMRCPWCHNPETLEFKPEVVWHAGRCLGDRGCIETCETGALAATEAGITVDRERCRGCGACVAYCPSEALQIHGRSYAIDDLSDELRRDAAFYEASGGGVTLSGGEPLAQPEGAIALLEHLHEAGTHTALDTCGAVGADALRRALDAADLVLFDVKTVDAAKHKAYTGVPFERVDASARIVEEAGVAVWVRTPVIPGYTADEENLQAVARYVAETFTRCERHDLLAFSNLCRPKYEQLDRSFALADTPLLSADEMGRLADRVRGESKPGIRVCWSGPTRIQEAVA
ncbi:MAG TPA: glycyl-radical enzyme activating protein, partial [Candidatus Hydrogenedentes bacterium]|nr:glycyl-radical enzyme activating protein [Candidatus Hydrogenedentota bacterium]